MFNVRRGGARCTTAAVRLGGSRRRARNERMHTAPRHAPVQLPAERLLARARGVDEPREVDPGADAERLEEAD